MLGWFSLPDTVCVVAERLTALFELRRRRKSCSAERDVSFPMLVHKVAVLRAW